MDGQPWFSDGEGALSAVFAHALPPLMGRAPAATLAPLTASAGTVSPLERASIEEIRRHARRLATLSGVVGRSIGLPAADVETLRLGSLLHDIGKAAIPPQVLFKCGRLSTEEFAAVKYHPIIGDLLCARVRGLERARPIVRHHHERLDGTGYPDGLQGDEIPLLAQIVGIIDVYDALVYPRPYKPAFDREHAFGILLREARFGWRDTALTEALIDVVDRQGDALAIVASV